jgi:uncharacterized membrane protein YkgB
MRGSEWLRREDGQDLDQPDRRVSAYSLWKVNRILEQTNKLSVKWFELIARIAIFIIYFWFGLLKILNLSPATPLASALVKSTIGMPYFTFSFKTLAVYEVVLGVLFLIPALTWLSTGLLVVHLVIVTSPLVLVANVAWVHPLVPTLEGQYIIKDVAILALAVGIIAYREMSSREVAVPPVMANTRDRAKS